MPSLGTNTSTSRHIHRRNGHNCSPKYTYKNNQSSAFYNGPQMETAQIYLKMERDKLIKLCSWKSRTMNDLELPIIQVSPQTIFNERSYKQNNMYYMIPFTYSSKTAKAPHQGSRKASKTKSYMLLDLDGGHVPMLSFWKFIKLYMYSHISRYFCSIRS